MKAKPVCPKCGQSDGGWVSRWSVMDGRLLPPEHLCATREEAEIGKQEKVVA